MSVKEKKNIFLNISKSLKENGIKLNRNVTCLKARNIKGVSCTKYLLYWVYWKYIGCFNLPVIVIHNSKAKHF